MTTTHQHSRYLTLGMMLAATNMRLPITMMPGLISSLKRTLGLPSSMAGLLTTIPLLTFAIDCTLGAAIWQRTDYLCRVDLSSRWELSAGHPNDCGPFHWDVTCRDWRGRWQRLDSSDY